MSYPQRGSHNGKMIRPWPLALVPARRSAIGRAWRWVSPLATAILLASCSSSVNQELIASPTPYPVRSPVVPDELVGVLEIPPTGPGATAAAALRRRDAAQAEAAFSTVIAATPRGAGAVDAYLGRAQARDLAGDPRAALIDLDEAVRLAPERGDLLLVRAAVQARLGAAEEALADFGAAIRLDPGAAVAYEGRGLVEVWSAKGDPVRYQAALDDFKRAIALDPTLATARIGPALVYADRAAFRGDPTDRDHALRTLDALPELAGDPRVGALRARLLAERGDQAGAEQALSAARAALDGSPPALEATVDLAASVVALEAGDWVTAEREARAAIAVDPFLWDARRILARAQLGRGDGLAALVTLDDLLTALPEDGEALYLRGVALTSLRRGEEARRVLEAARDALLASPVYQARIAEALERIP
ncbi:MAG: tetratricopeptide repeat protein [Chloroflexota bacterium]|nr:tetratricopeptide repeat protein [Chloroflexota bacterium]